jgi:GNAT superfamily N-acetyltransferase
VADTRFTIEPLTLAHRRAAFSCGEPALDAFIRQYARQQQARGLNRTYVALAVDVGDIAGYYSINASSVLTAELPADLRLPRYPVPALRIGRLAVDTRFQGQGLGQLLLRHSFKLALEMAQRVGIFAVVVDAKHARAAAFYKKLGFAPFASRPLSLYLALGTLAAAIG